MDLNQLLYHHQVALMRSEDSYTPVASGSRFDMVSYYERRIARLRRDMGVKQFPALLSGPSPVAL